jgi:ribonuclease HI
VTERYVVATDGACKGNPGPAGWAWVAEDGHWAAGSVPEGTNNIGELLGLLAALTDHAAVADLVIQADSKYAIDTYTKWMSAHARRGWKTAAGQPVKNREILESLMAARDAPPCGASGCRPRARPRPRRARAQRVGRRARRARLHARGAGPAQFVVVARGAGAPRRERRPHARRAILICRVIALTPDRDGRIGS